MSEKPKKWAHLHMISTALGGHPSRPVEEALNDMIRNGRIKSWRFLTCDYDVLTSEDPTTIELEVYNLAREKLKRGFPFTRY
ncbi:MAG: hypothetical protein ACE5Z5_06910 [Candidatus Bathyarchaeia archaeon]